MKIMKVGAVMAVVVLSGCCTVGQRLGWSGGCFDLEAYPYIPPPESIEKAEHEAKYRQYERMRERRVVQGLGGAMYHTDDY